jgi:predicted nucleic acid-binding protein
MIVVDASVLVTALGHDGDEGRQVRERLRGKRVFAPEIVDLEVASYVRRARREGQIGPQRAVQALADLALASIARVSHTPFLSRIWELRDNLTPYDAAYVVLAETMQAPLVTADARMSRAPGIRCEVVVLS